MTDAYDDRYLLSRNPDAAEFARLALLESAYDPDTRRRLLALGVKAGWRCLEVGSGRGSIARWLVDVVGPSGHVLATDVNPRFLGGIAGPTLEVRQHNIVTDELEAGAFDLVCARAVLEHLPERARALDRMVAALKPGGLIYLEDGDYSGEFGHVMASSGAAGDAEYFTRSFRPLMEGLAARGVLDVRFGRRLSLEFEARGLVDVGNEGVVRTAGPDDDMTRFWAMTLQNTQPTLEALGLMDGNGVQSMLRVFNDPALRWVPVMIISAWGRRA